MTHIEKWKNDLKIPVDPIQVNPGDQNPADIGTPGKARADQLTLSDVWQTGPTWLVKEREDWPMETLRSQDVYNIPEKERHLQVFTLQVQFPTSSRVDDIMAYSDSLLKVEGIMARVLRVLLLKDKLSVFLPLSADDYARASYFLKKHAMLEIHKMVESKDLTTLDPFKSNGLFYTRGHL